MKGILLVLVLLVCGVVSMFMKSAGYANLAKETKELCLSGTENCFLGIFGIIDYEIGAFVINLLIIAVFLYMKKIKRKELVFLMGLIVYLFTWVILGTLLDSERLKSWLFIDALVYLIAFGSQYLIFSKWLK